MPATNVREAKHAIVGGAAAGLIAGVLLAILFTLSARAGGHDAWPMVKWAAAPFIGDAAARPGFDAAAVAIGILANIAVSITWGILFGLVAYGLTIVSTVLTGAAFGAVVWLVMFYAVLPIVGLAEMARMTTTGVALVTHLVFGLTLGVGFLPFQRRKPAPFARGRAQPASSLT
jgi:hypothetical protein